MELTIKQLKRRGRLEEEASRRTGDWRSDQRRRGRSEEKCRMSNDSCRLAAKKRNTGTWPAVCGLWRTGGGRWSRGDLEKVLSMWNVEHIKTECDQGLLCFLNGSNIILFFNFFLKVISDGILVARWSLSGRKLNFFFFKSHLFFFRLGGATAPPCPQLGPPLSSVLYYANYI